MFDINALFEHNHSPDLKDTYSHTPLSLAAKKKKKRYKTVVKMLLDKGVEADAKDKYIQTSLSWAAYDGHEAVVKLLLAIGSADLD
jgi:ankyrin repeat protein